MSTPESTEQTPLILVVDDNQDNRDLIRRRLERSGYRVVEAEDGPSGLDIVRQQSIDLVILDVMMPGMSGIEVLQILRRSHTTAELPVIMATAKDQSEDLVEALDHGANDYVTKPLDFPVVLARVQAHLRTRTAARDTSPDDDISWGDVEPGKVLADKYRLEAEIGSGNFGTVYHATHLGLEESVAVKVLHGSVDHSPEAISRFQQEGVSAFRLQHPNAVSVLDFHTTSKGFAFLVMEILDGHSLELELKGNSDLSAHRASEIVLPICDVLVVAHNMGIIHRDIKPANIFLHRDRRGEVIKVLDFGIAKLVGEPAVDNHLTLDESILGTPAYMAPERLRNQGYDGRADVYSLGIMLYQMLAGKPPFHSERNEAIAVAMAHLMQEPVPLDQHRDDLPRDLVDVVMASLVKDPRERPNAREFSDRLKQVLAGRAPSRAAESLVRGDEPTDEDLFAAQPLIFPPTNVAAPEKSPAVFIPEVLGDPWE